MHDAFVAVNAATIALKLTTAAVNQACTTAANTFTKTLTLTLNPTPKDVTKPNPNSTYSTNPNRLSTNPSLLPQ